MIRLCFGSFIVAILVGALNKVIASESTEEKRAARDQSMPPELIDAW